MRNKKSSENLSDLFRRNKGILRTSEAIKLGVHPRVFYQMRDDGRIVELSRGIFRLAELTMLNETDLTTASLRVPAGVVCLISALFFHGLTTEIPHEVYMALPREKANPKVDYPPLRIFHFSNETYTAGVEKHSKDGIEIKVFSPEKTVADCFKFRNRIGLDVAIEGLKNCLQRRNSRAKILEYAKICRIEKIIRPYLEAID
jgi:predicted transcriptional regulator of viral defense system